MDFLLVFQRKFSFVLIGWKIFNSRISLISTFFSFLHVTFNLPFIKSYQIWFCFGGLHEEESMFFHTKWFTIELSSWKEWIDIGQPCYSYRLSFLLDPPQYQIGWLTALYNLGFVNARIFIYQWQKPQTDNNMMNKF